ncbi:MAG: DoxX family membrane protein [Candidatus Adlerbacteria bacterium]|nr:DoxX family membrane protein [Candidatus Adlerbacteria bacterium]MDZ4226398.1 DoxX family membrane protein [Patescibacteria group bacterium]
MSYHTIEESPFSHFLLANTKMAGLWLVVRLYLGWEWLQAGWGKLHNDAWVGENTGAALTGFVNNALAKTSGPHPDVQWWYAWFLEQVVLPNTETMSYVVATGEFLVGAALIVGFLVGVSAFFGMFMNFNFMLAGSVSINPIWFAIGIGLVLAWRIAGYYGLDYWVLPRLHRFLRPRRT